MGVSGTAILCQAAPTRYLLKVQWWAYIVGWNIKQVWNSNCSPLFGFPMGFGFPMTFEIWNKMVAILSKSIGNPYKMAAILFGFPMDQFWNGRYHSYSYCCDQPFQNQTLGNWKYKKFGIPMCLVFQCVWYSNVWYSSPHCIYKYLNILIWFISGWKSISIQKLHYKDRLHKIKSNFNEKQIEIVKYVFN